MLFIALLTDAQLDAYQLLKDEDFTDTALTAVKMMASCHQWPISRKEIRDSSVQIFCCMQFNPPPEQWIEIGKRTDLMKTIIKYIYDDQNEALNEWGMMLRNLTTVEDYMKFMDVFVISARTKLSINPIRVTVLVLSVNNFPFLSQVYDK